MARLNGTKFGGASSDLPARSRDADDIPQDADLIWPPETESFVSTESSEFEVERSRLEAEILVARTRTATARRRLFERDEALRAEVAASQQDLAEIEREHEAAVHALREDALSEVARIIAEARRSVADRPATDVVPEQMDVSDAG